MQYLPQTQTNNIKFRLFTNEKKKNLKLKLIIKDVSKNTQNGNFYLLGLKTSNSKIKKGTNLKVCIFDLYVFESFIDLTPIFIQNNL